MTSAAPTFSRYQKLVIALLAFVSFTVTLDFMILSPLGALLMQELDIPTARFGLVVSGYAYAAGAAGFLSAGFADRFDRKKLLLFFYAGFVLGTLFCGLAPSYEYLLAARMITGLFGGVLSSVNFAIVADLFPLQQRGRVMGLLQASFGAAQVLGLPLGLWLSNHWGWHAPFFMIVGVGSAVGVVMVVGLRPIDAHLALARAGSPIAHVGRTLVHPRYLLAYAATTVLVTGGFMLMPFGSAFSVHNLGLSLDQLPTVYMATGVTALLAGPLLGRVADAVGRYRMFLTGSLVFVAVVSFYTRLGATPLLGVIAINIVLFLGINARMIAWSTLTSAIPEPADRGAYMSVSSSIMQVAGGVASTAAGLLISEGPDGTLLHYERLGNVVAVAAAIALGIVFFMDREVRRRTAAAAAAAPAPAVASRPAV